MPSQLEAWIRELQIWRKKAQRALDQLRDQVDRLNQTARVQAGGAYGGGGTGGGPGVFVAVTPAGGIAAASGAPAGGTPGSASCSVYQLVGGTYTLLGSYTVYNPMLSATAAAAKVVTVHPNGDGTYTLSSESCT
jgi:hypothetical protein